MSVHSVTYQFTRRQFATSKSEYQTMCDTIKNN